MKGIDGLQKRFNDIFFSQTKLILLIQYKIKLCYLKYIVFIYYLLYMLT